ncbi:hypothetical protein V8E53_008561 [Lactarius tabidus]
MSIQAMEHVLNQSTNPNELELNDVPPEVWAVLRTAVPVRGSTLENSISRASSFAEARESTGSGASSPMDDSPTHANTTPLFLAGSSTDKHLSISYHPQSIKAEGPLPHAIGDQEHPISVHSSASDRHAITTRLANAPASLSILEERLTPSYQLPLEIYNATLSLRSLASMPIRGNSIGLITGQNDRYFKAIGLMDTIRDELNQAAEGHSHYFLNEPLTIMQDPAFPVQSDELCRILDLAAAALSVGSRTNNTDDVWSLLRPSDWYRAATHTMAAILRGCVCTKNVGHLGDFPFHPLRDIYRNSSALPAVNTQCDLLEAISLQIAEHLSLDNGPYLPQDNNLLNEASVEEISNTVREDIALQTCSKYNNMKLEAENKAFHEMINQAIAEGKDRASKEALETYAVTSRNLCKMKERQAKEDADKYFQVLLDKAKEQARLKADSEFSCLLADERSAIAPRVDAEIALEHKKLVEERRIAMEAQLQALTLEEEKKLVHVAAARLGISLQVEEHTAKKVKVDQRKARPAPVTPRGRSDSVASNISTKSSLHKRAHSPTEITATAPSPDREDQKTSTPKNVTTVAFEIKAEPTPPLSFVTPPTPSVIRDAVNTAKEPSFATPLTPSVIRDAVLLAQDLTPTNSLRGSSSSIHNQANQMSIDLENLNLANIFPPGIPLPPTNISLPPAMMMAFMQKFNQPLWDTIHRLEQAIGNGRIPRIPQRAGPGYRSEHTKPMATRASSSAVGPAVTTQDTRSRQDAQAAPPFPSEPPVPGQPISIAATPQPIARVDDDEFPEIEPTSRGTRRRRNVASAALQQRHNIPGATGPDDGHIAITNNNSRIKPLFANIATRDAVAQQQLVQHSAAQARAFQGQNPSGNAKKQVLPADRNLTEVTVIRFGGLDNEEEERKFRAWNPVEIIQSVQRELSHQAKNPPAVLSGRWSTTANTTGNFIYTIAGIIPPRDLMSMKPFLCRPFKGHTELVPTKGWTWVQLRLVPTEDLDGCVWGQEDLLAQFIANPCFQDALICIAPHWQGNLLNNDKERSTVLAAIIDEDNSICQNALTHGVRMFGAQVKFLRCGDNPTLLQCSRCHLLRHYANAEEITTEEITITNAIPKDTKR